MVAATNMLTVYQTMVIMGGITVFLVIAVLGIVAYQREVHDRPFLPWAARMSVERQKARTEIMQEELEQTALEVKRLAIDHQRTRVMEAINANRHEDVERLGLPQTTQRGDY